MNKKVANEIRKEAAEWYASYYEAKKLIDELKERKVHIDKQMERLMDDSGNGVVEFDISSEGAYDKIVRAVRVLNKKVEFDANRLESQLKMNDVSKDIQAKIIRKTYTINNWSKFTKMLQRKGVKAKDVLPYITVEKEVDSAQIDELEELGYISYKDVKGCYVVKNLTSHIRYSFKKK